MNTSTWLDRKTPAHSALLPKALFRQELPAPILLRRRIMAYTHLDQSISVLTHMGRSLQTIVRTVEM